MAIRIIVDSSSDIPKELLNKYNILVVPLTILLNGAEYQDGVDITPSEFYALLSKTTEAPTTSQVTPERFLDAFNTILAEGDEILCICLGSNASGTFQAAQIAKSEINSSKITVVDSNALCMGIGYIVILVAQLIENGHKVNEILDIIAPLIENKIEHLFCVDTLEYLKRGGRIRASKAFVAEILNIKPILNVKDALTQPIGKVRGHKKVIPYYLTHIENTIDLEANPFICVAHSENEPFAKEFVDSFREKFNFEKPIYVTEIGATIGTHTGPGVLAAFYIKK